MQLESGETIHHLSREGAWLVFPRDIAPEAFEVPEGFEVLEKTTFYTEGNEAGFDVIGASYIADVLKARTEFVSYRVTRTAVLVLKRPTNLDPNDISESKFNINLKFKDLVLRTIDNNATQGAAYVRVSITIDGMGEVYYAFAQVVQGQQQFRMTGEIPKEKFEVAIGSAELRSYETSKSVTIPKELDSLRVTITLETSGFGILTNTDR